MECLLDGIYNVKIEKKNYAPLGQVKGSKGK